MHVADDRHSSPCDGRGPECSDIGDSSANGGQVRVRGGEEMKCDLGRENRGGERRLEKGREEGLEDTKSFTESVNGSGSHKNS